MLAYVTPGLKKPDFLNSREVRYSHQATMSGQVWAPTIELPKYSIPKKFLEFEDGVKCFKITPELKQIPRKQVIGKKIKMGDNQEWAFPILRKVSGGTTLPSRLMMTEAGMQFQVKPQHLKAWNWGSAILEHLFTDKKMTDMDVITCLADILSINYDCISIYEIASYGLIDDSIGEILSYLVDLPDRLQIMTEEAKKKRVNSVMHLWKRGDYYPSYFEWEFIISHK